MSWVVQDFWRELDSRLDTRSANPTFRIFSEANEVAEEVGKKWDLTIQLNFPAGPRSEMQLLGRSNLSILVERGRKKFQGVSETEVRNRLERLDSSVRFEPAGHGYEGFRVLFDGGRIDCLPGGVHLWCEITDQVLQFLDWLFINAYGVSPTRNERSK